ncbi:MAG: glycosyltransferase family protein [Rhodospirillales bacterium]|nr:glycosyltransferase family protein [Rhodospirillales bacterium]
MRTVASIEARMGSSRLRGKMTADIVGRPVLVRVIERLRQTQSLDAIVLATSTADDDRELAVLAETEGIVCFRGGEDDVLGRVAEVHGKMGSETVVQICGDCPLLDPDIVDQAVEVFSANACDLVAAGAKQSFPQGTEVNVLAFDALSDLAATTQDPAHREHVTLGFHEQPDRYRVLHLMAPKALQAPELRLQLDYPEDLELIRRIYGALEPKMGPRFRTADILSLIREDPRLARINRHCDERAVR